ncbi:MAG: nitroreductase family protein [Clostridiales bacterium]|nr:nitroreductase family protein [Clostridiales bacterium]MCD8153660.1 nitroreductase family protein [Clostridiales bacterium]
MTTIENILNRRSIRRYTDTKIDTDTMHTLLTCAMAGPSCVNARDWSFIVVDNKDLLRKLADCNGRPASMLPDAAAAVIVCGDLSRAFKKAREYWIIDGSIAAQNIILAANELGIGSVWLGTYPQMERVNNIRHLFALPEDIVPHSIIALGYPDEKGNGDKLLYEENRVHFNRW